MAKKSKLEFEEALGELENIVKALENRDLHLKDALVAFERGMELSDVCSSKLQEAESKLKVYKESHFEELDSLTSEP
ncbi:MAG: exodeoxyribonuclease VII small subunit [Candidatus Cloacimonetes bacterium]|nr:exodeoxyribonuclease VII small subunit [Candidatus Cloacimonadota bacterium]